MPSVHDTAYPRLKAAVTVRDLAEVYTPTLEEQTLAATLTPSVPSQVGLLIMLKTFQRLGYFVPIQAVPQPIVDHIATHIGTVLSPQEFSAYDASGTRRHQLLLRMAPALANRQRIALHDLMDNRKEIWHAQAFHALFRKLDQGLGAVTDHRQHASAQVLEPLLNHCPVCSEEMLVNEASIDVAIGAATFRGEYTGGMPIIGCPGCHGETME